MHVRAYLYLCGDHRSQICFGISAHANLERQRSFLQLGDPDIAIPRPPCQRSSNGSPSQFPRLYEIELIQQQIHPPSPTVRDHIEQQSLTMPLLLQRTLQWTEPYTVDPLHRRPRSPARSTPAPCRHQAGRHRDSWRPCSTARRATHQCTIRMKN